MHRDFESRPKLREIWVEQWQKLQQSKIQAWVQRIVCHIKEVIRLAGGNDYREGREDSALDIIAKQEQTA